MKKITLLSLAACFHLTAVAQPTSTLTATISITNISNLCSCTITATQEQSTLSCEKTPTYSAVAVGTMPNNQFNASFTLLPRQTNLAPISNVQGGTSYGPGVVLNPIGSNITAAATLAEDLQNPSSLVAVWAKIVSNSKVIDTIIVPLNDAWINTSTCEAHIPPYTLDNLLNKIVTEKNG